MFGMLLSVIILFAICLLAATIFYFIIAYAMGWKRHICSGCGQKLVFNKSKPLTQCPHCKIYISDTKANH